MTIGNKIKARREELGLTQVEVAEKVKVSQASLSFIERGINTPSAPLLIVFAMVLNLDPSELLKMRDERKAS